MKKIYNGYELSTAWDDEALGFGFSVHDKKGMEVSKSTDPYFYEENALTEARAAADALPAQE